jgi:hypothetical protein
MAEAYAKATPKRNRSITSTAIRIFALTINSSLYFHNLENRGRSPINRLYAKDKIG